MVRAVIVDDEDAAVVIIQHMIQKSNFPIKITGTAKNGRSALSLIRKEDPELIFLDINMPQMNGFELMQEEPYRKYIIITAYESFQYAQKALRMGAQDILLKPVDYESFCTAIVKATGWKFTGSDMINEIMEYIQHHYAEHIEVNQLAEKYFTSASHISRTFKKYTGHNVLAYLHAVRIQEAIRLIENSTLSIKEIAGTCGYENLNNFYIDGWQ